MANASRFRRAHRHRKHISDGSTEIIPSASLLADLRRVEKKIGKRIITLKEYKAAGGKYSKTTYFDRLGSWSEACRRAGLEAGHECNISPADLLKDLRRIAKKFGKRTVTIEEYEAAGGRYSPSTYYDRFGSWSEARRRAGLEVGRENNISLATLLLDLRRVAKKIGRKLITQKEYKAGGGKYSKVTFYERFGLWSEACRRAGLKVGYKRNIPLSDLLQDLRRIAEKLGKQNVSIEEYRAAGGKYDPVTFFNRFNSWSEAHRQAGLIPNDAQHQRAELLRISTLPGLTMADQVAIAKTLPALVHLTEDVLLGHITRVNLGPLRLPPVSLDGNGVAFWVYCIEELERVQPDARKLTASGVPQRLAARLYRAAAVEVLGREPLTREEEARVVAFLVERRKAMEPRSVEPKVAAHYAGT